MKILRGNNLNVDFQNPINLDKEQQEKFISFLKTLFYDVELQDTKCNIRSRMGEKLFSKEWSSKELALIFKIDEINDEVTKKLGRTWMSVVMRRGLLIPMILQYASKKNVDIYQVNIEKLIEDFLNENEEIKLMNKLKKQEERLIERHEKNELILLKDEVPKFRGMAEQGIGGITRELVKLKEDRLKNLEEKYKI
jgi:hypothetical protein